MSTHTAQLLLFSRAHIFDCGYLYKIVAAVLTLYKVSYVVKLDRLVLLHILLHNFYLSYYS